MKPEFNKKYNTIAAYVLIVAAILISYILLIIFWKDVKSAIGSLIGLLSPFFYGFAIAYILNPVYNLLTDILKKLFCSKKRHSNRSIKITSLIFTYVIALAFIALFFYIIGPQLWQSFQKLYGNFPSYISAVEKFLDLNLSDFPLLSSDAISGFLTSTENSLVDWLEKVYDTLTQYTPRIITFITGFATQIWNFVLGFIISIYMLADKKRFSCQSKKLLYAVFKKERAEVLIQGTIKMHRTFGGFISGKIIDSFIIGVLCFFGMNILAIPYSPLVSVVVGVTNVIPYFGPFMGAIPSAFIILLDDPIKAIWFAIFILVLQQLDGNVIGPKIIGQKIGLSSFWVIFALLIMGSLMGIVGLLLAVPIFALIYDFIKYLCNRALSKKGYTGKDINCLCSACSEIPDSDISPEDKSIEKTEDINTKK